MNEMHDTREEWDHTRWRIHDLGWRSSGECEEVVYEVFGRKRSVFLSREIEKNERKIMLRLYIEKHESRWIECYWEMSSTNSQQMYLSRCYQELSTAKWPQWIEQLLRIYQVVKKFLNGSRIYGAAIETNSQKLQWIEIALTFVEKGRSKISIDSLAIERCREVQK